MDVLSILSLGLKPLYIKNMAYYKLILEFKKKLPRPQNSAKAVPLNKLTNTPFNTPTIRNFGLTDISKHQTSVTDSELDYFYNSIHLFNYSLVLFKDYYRNYSKNLLRFNPTSNNKDFDLIVIQEILNDKFHPLHPWKVFLFHLKYKYKWSSKIFKTFLKLKHKTKQK